jgi:hypothetical protein
MGGLVFAEGSHVHGTLNPAVAARRFPVMKNAAMCVGDISIHMGWTLHGALKNLTETVREAMSICHYADGTRIDAPADRIFDEIFMTRFFPGLRPGDIAAGKVTPVVFPYSGV